MNYSDILKQSWHIIWQNKFFWILGLLAALGGSSVSGSAQFNGNSFNNISTPSGTSGTSGSSGSGDFTEFETLLEELGVGNFNNIPWDTIGPVVGILASIILCLMLFKLIMYFIRFIAESGMIQAAFNIANGQESDFRRAFAAGRPFVFPMFGMRLLLSLPILIVILVMLIVGAAVVAQMATAGDPMAAGTTMLAFAPLAGCVICLMVPISLFTSLLYPVAQRGMVLRGMGAVDSLRHAWYILKNNIGDMLLLGFIFVVLGLVIGIIAAIIAVPILIASGAPLFFALATNNFDFSAVSSALYVLIGVGFLVMILISACVNAIAVSYRSTAFTLAYIEFANKAKLAKAAEEI